MTVYEKQDPVQASTAAVTVRDLQICTSSGVPVVTDLSFEIAPGEVLGLVGESGSGKTTVGLSLLGHARRGLRIDGGTIMLGDQDILRMGDDELRRLRGSLVSYVPQDPASSLNPALRIGVQLREVLSAHGSGNRRDNDERIAEMMREVALSDDPSYLRRYPHELSGGQQQRVGLAMAFANRPRLIVLDEPTTGLDVTTQATVLSTVHELAEAHDVAALYVSHDLAVVAAVASRVAVMYAGRVVELGLAEELFDSSAHPYTRRLVGAIPRLTGGRSLVGIPGHAPSPGKRPPGCAFAPRCTMHLPECDAEVPALVPLTPVHSARCIRAHEVVKQAQTKVGDQVGMAKTGADSAVLTLENVVAHYGTIEVLHSINLTLEPHECLAVVGESGSGKTTTARSIAGLHRNWTGSIRLGDQELETAARSRSTESRRQIQYIFQNPYGSLNPRKTVGETVGQPLSVFGIAKGRAAEQRVAEMLEQVSLSASYANRYPDQLSGGERQRVAIARALISSPSILICDEVTSALDVSVQAAIVELLGKLQRELGLSMVFVTHNLPLVRSIAQKVAVLADGNIVEFGETATVLADPQQPYTRELIANTPSLETATGEVVVTQPRLPATPRPLREPAAPARCPDPDGRPTGDERPAVPRQPGHPGAGHVVARRGRRGLRQRLHGQSALLAGPGIADDRVAAVAHARLRQRRRVLLRDPHLRPLPPRCGLSDDVVGQDALLRAGPAARFRGAPHHRHLSGRLRLDPRLGCAPRPAALVPRHVVGHRRRPVRPLQPARLRRRGGVRGRAAPVRARSLGRRATVSASSSRSRTRTTRMRSPDSGGTPIATRTSRCLCSGTTRRARTRMSAGYGRCARWTASRSPTSRSARPCAPTYGAVTYVDDRIGRLIEVLRQTGRLDDTVVILTSDHGDMLGERGLWYKMSFFEGSVRVPLVVSAPGRFEPGRVSAPVSTMDLLPTLVGLAEDGDLTGIVGSLDGQSLLPLLAGQPSDRDTVMAEYLAEGAIAPIVMVRRGAMKLDPLAG